MVNSYRHRLFSLDLSAINIIGGVNQVKTQDTASGQREERKVTKIVKDGEAAILEIAKQWPSFTSTPDNRFFQPVCLPASWKENIGEYGVVAGFGTNESERMCIKEGSVASHNFFCPSLNFCTFVFLNFCFRGIIPRIRRASFPPPSHSTSDETEAVSLPVCGTFLAQKNHIRKV